MTIPTGVALQDEIDAAVERLERLSDRKPFLQDASDVEKTFNPPYGDFLNLEGVWSEIVEVAVDGDVVEEGEDYWPEPPDGPFTSLRWNGKLMGSPQTVKVTGIRGTTIPVEVWNAVRDYAAASVFSVATVTEAVPLGPVSEIQQDTVKIKYAGGSAAMGQDTSSKMRANAEKIFRSYRRLSVGDYS